MQVIFSENAPKAIGPYSQAMQTGNLIFVSGQLPVVPETMTVISADVAEQAEQSIQNIKAILATRDLTLNNVVKASVFLSDMADFAAVNAVYSEHFNEIYPARTCVQVARLPMEAKVEIEVIAEIA
ncbi:2-iminobutanoate/2-iminopropanoate deaminase [Vibrio stylophorae]|uniref:2-iminobutanoate/2-iminopropanoate deaminase n=2 Tax=Vibrio stylophorae TaxID=659351 RepID=A0ABN8DX35_9VIBR|nr:2-iminobutanoate/2-iminopropanoate deaminase [Vibrio stylophorae]